MVRRTGAISFCLLLMVATPGSALAACYPGLGDCADGDKPQAVPLPTEPAPPPRQPEPAKPATVEYHYVGPVFPPDPWLALRSMPSGKAGYQIMKMPEGTLFRLLETRGSWYHVQLRDGTTGWAHSGWIKCCKYAEP